ncbi:hypothetical protein F5B22DRAFT_615657 [Xylaria bambusicola]|uniref:uncharacterized protein n=1 Tax=Xylaria bambusicola TaxID=326684 RepID=UPI002007FFA7|nr:uncharacterized protein F5B22DRAFT_615657 [Xylaria bambusicola]KAI0509697.1 hypothetical protein F5B22DRAFT_615657 [Xylaria bambusicola]
MLTPSGEYVHSKRPQSQSFPGKQLSRSQRHLQLQNRDAKYRAHSADSQRISKRKSRDGIEHQASRALRSSGYYGRRNWSPCNSNTAVFNRSRCSITKQHQNRVEESGQVWPQTNTEDTNIQTDASPSSTSEPASYSSREQYHTAASTSLSDVNTNEQLLDCVLDANIVDTAYLTPGAPSSERTQQDLGSDDTPGVPEDGEQAAAASQKHPDTEYHANLFAAPEDSRYLFEEYYKQTYGEIGKETESRTDAYWKWDQKRHQWFHEDPDTHSVVWFLG